MQIVNPLMVIVAAIQVVAGAWGIISAGQPKMGAVMVLVGIANAIVATIKA